MKTCPYCAEFIQDAAIVCKHCGRDLQAASTSTATADVTSKTKKKTSGATKIAALFFCLLLIAFIASQFGGTPSEGFTAQHEAALQAALSAKGLGMPVHTELSSAGFLTADFEAPDTVAAGGRANLRAFGEVRLLTIRDALLPFGFKNYRVNVNGPSPGTGLIRRYGSSRFTDGGSLEWLTP